MTGYGVNFHKLVAFLYINNKHSEKEIMNTFLYTIASKRIKHLGTNLTKEVINLYGENCKSLKSGRQGKGGKQHSYLTMTPLDHT